MTDYRSPLTELPLGLPGRFYRSPMPFSPYDRLGEVWDAYRAAEISLVVVLAEPQEYLVHARRDLPSGKIIAYPDAFDLVHARRDLPAFYRTAGLEVLAHPIPDFGVPPDPDDFRTALKRVRAHLESGRHVAAHCMAGVGRTGLFAACLARDVLDLPPQEAVAWVRRYIPGALESEAQVRFVGRLVGWSGG